MIYRLTEQAPVSSPVSVAEAKAWMRVTHTDHDAMILDLLTSVSMQAENVTGLAFNSRQFVYTAEATSSISALSLELPRKPLVSVDSIVKYASDQEATTLVDEEDYHLTQSGSVLFTGLALSIGEVLKTTFTAGAEPPEPIKTIIKREVSRQYTYSSDVVIGTAVIRLPKDALDALTQYRRFSC